MLNLQEDILQTLFEDFLMTLWRRLERQKNVMLKASLKRLREVFNTSSLRRMSAGIELFNYFYKKPSL